MQAFMNFWKEIESSKFGIFNKEIIESVTENVTRQYTYTDYTIHIQIKVNYAINKIYENTFRSDLSTQKNLPFDELLTTSYFLLLFIRTC